MLLTKLKGEVWKSFRRDDWRDNEEYHVSYFGRVYSEKHYNKKLKFKLTVVNGYEAFSAMRKNNTTDLVYVHRIVSELFIENKENKSFVIHLDFNKTNNIVSNLAWATRKEMVDHNQKNPTVILGKEKRRHSYPYAKLSEAKVKMIKRKIFNPNRKTRMRLIAKQFGISEMQLYRIKSGENWGHVTDY